MTKSRKPYQKPQLTKIDPAAYDAVAAEIARRFAAGLPLEEAIRAVEKKINGKGDGAK